METSRLGAIYETLDPAQLRQLFLEVVRVLPAARDVAVNQLLDQRSNLANRRTVSVDNLVAEGSSFLVSTPIKGKSKPKRYKGHAFFLHNYSKPTVCCACGLGLEGIIRQGVCCRHCLLDAHIGCLSDLPPCRGKPKRAFIKRKGKKPPPGIPILDKRGVKKGGARGDGKAGGGATGTTKRERKKSHENEAKTLKDHEGAVERDDSSSSSDAGDPTYIEALPQTPPPPRAHHGIQVSVSNGTPDIYDDEEDPQNSSDGESSHSEYDNTEENSSCGEWNSSDGESDDETGDGHSLTMIREEEELAAATKAGEKSLLHPGAQNFSRKGKKDRLGGTQDWTTHSKSFRMRLQNSSPLTKAALEIVSKNHTLLEKQFEDIPQNRVNIVTMPKLTEDKNRYMNVLPNNHSRVLLPQIEDDTTSTYINANWMDSYGPTGKDWYIACQGPLPETIYDFWRMIWEHKCSVIVMNTNLVEGEEKTVKCERYWPESPESDPFTVKDFTITSKSADRKYSQFIKTKMTITHNGETRSLTHLWWTDWPDKGVPKTPNGIGHLINEARAAKEEEGGGPAVVHCSAGIGRTGCFLAIDYCMRQFDAEARMDILKCVCQLRQSRGMTVQTAMQYRFIHMVLQRYTEGKLLDDVQDEVLRQESNEDSEPNAGLRRGISRKNRPLSFQLSKSRKLHFKERKSSDPEGSNHHAPLVRQKSAEHIALQEAIVAGGAVKHGCHEFKYKTFVRPTACDVCDALLQGLALQGIRCTRCKQNVHVECLSGIPEDTCELKSNVHRQPSGLPQWPPNRPTQRSPKKKLQLIVEGDDSNLNRMESSNAV